MLPFEPKIFYGRESELNHVVIARAVLHHAKIAEKYKLCVFVACDSAYYQHPTGGTDWFTPRIEARKRSYQTSCAVPC